MTCVFRSGITFCNISTKAKKAFFAENNTGKWLLATSNYVLRLLLQICFNKTAYTALLTTSEQVLSSISTQGQFLFHCNTNLSLRLNAPVIHS